jgi:hypothetical protein
MMQTAEMIRNYNEIRQRLQHPHNAVPDLGINLKRKLLPPAPIPQAPSEVLEGDAAFVRACVVQVIEVKAPVPPKVITLKSVERAVCRHFGVRAIALKGVCRENKITYPRHVFCYLARTLTGSSYPHIGRWLGGRDHTTTLHGYRRIREMILVDQACAYDVKILESMIRGGHYVCETDLPRSPLAAIAKCDLAQKQENCLPESEVYSVDN